MRGHLRRQRRLRARATAAAVDDHADDGSPRIGDEVTIVVKPRPPAKHLDQGVLDMV